MTISDEVFVATALLHREHAGRQGFRGAEIQRRIARLHPARPVRAGVNAHIYQHCVANREPSTLRHRILYQIEDGAFRLFRPGDDFHASRARGRTAPSAEALPAKWAPLVDWYHSVYAKAGSVSERTDPILALRGQGKQMWRELGGEQFIAGLRSNWFGPAGGAAQEPAFPEIWSKVVQLAGETFRTRRGLPFQYDLAGRTAVWVDRNGRKINRQLWRGDFEKAWERRPLVKTTQVRDLQGYSYIFAILTDSRVAS